MLAIYGKHNNDKRYSGLDLENGGLVVNRIHMTVFDESQTKIGRTIIRTF